MLLQGLTCAWFVVCPAEECDGWRVISSAVHSTGPGSWCRWIQSAGGIIHFTWCTDEIFTGRRNITEETMRSGECLDDDDDDNELT